MARIRSIHPGLFTDEAFVGLSDSAQVFWIGLWCEADDQGVFEWKPLQLKMRLRAASLSPVEPLLAELEQADCIRKYEHNGHQLGAIRNFCRYQNPKSPKFTHVIPDDFRNYVGLSLVISPKSGNDSAEGEEGIGIGGDGGERSAPALSLVGSSPPAEPPIATQILYQLAEAREPFDAVTLPMSASSNLHHAEQWAAQGITPDLARPVFDQLCGNLSKSATPALKTLVYFDGALAKALLANPPIDPKRRAEIRAGSIKLAIKFRDNPAGYGGPENMRPGQPDCPLDADLQSWALGGAQPPDVILKPEKTGAVA